MSKEAEITFMQTRLIRLASEEWHLPIEQIIKKCAKRKQRERFKFCVNRKTDIRYVISYRGQNLFFRVLSLFVL